MQSLKQLKHMKHNNAVSVSCTSCSVQASSLGEKRRSIIGHAKPYCLHTVHVTSNLHNLTNSEQFCCGFPWTARSELQNVRAVSTEHPCSVLGMSVLCLQNVHALSATFIEEDCASMLTLDGLHGRQEDQVDSPSRNLTLLWVLWSGHFCPHVCSSRKARVHLWLWHHNMSFEVYRHDVLCQLNVSFCTKGLNTSSVITHNQFYAVKTRHLKFNGS